MLLQLNEELEDLIVVILASHPPLTVQQIRAALVKRDRSYSLQAVYKQLTKLQDNQVITKLKTLYTLNMAWIVNVSHLAKQLEEKSRQGFFSETLLPPSGTKKSWTLPDVWIAHEFWMHLALTLMCYCPSSSFYTWYALPWFELAHRQKRPNLWAAIRATGKRFYSLVGVDCQLTQFLLRTRPQDFYYPSMAPQLLETLDTKIFTVFDDYILSVETSKKFFNHIKNYFLNFNTANGFDREEVANMFKMRTQVKITLEHNVMKSGKLRKLIIQNHSGLKSIS